jgi:C-terminal processing protease CtpA/Prc
VTTRRNPDGTTQRQVLTVRAAEGTITFEGVGFALAGTAVAGQDADGNAVVMFNAPPMVESVTVGGLAERAGIRAGDLVVGVSTDVPLVADLPVLTGSGTMSLTDVRGIAALSSAGPGRPVVLTITRDGVQRQVVLQMN